MELAQGLNCGGRCCCSGDTVEAMTTEANGVLYVDASLDADLVWSAATATEIDGDCPCWDSSEQVVGV